MRFFSSIEPPLDPPEDVVIGYCACCGGEIYEGEDIYEIDGDLIHDDCLSEYAEKFFADCKTEAGRKLVFA